MSSRVTGLHLALQILTDVLRETTPAAYRNSFRTNCIDGMSERNLIDKRPLK